jgi:predicted amidohydrolase
MSATLKVALVQTNSARDIAPNLEIVGAQIRRAVDQGAEFVLTPENVCMIEPVREQALAKALPEADHPAIPFFSALAAETGAWLLAGSLSIKTEAGKISNRSFLFDGKGGIVARYSKIHLFDVDLANGESYRESAQVVPGDAAVVAPSPWGPIGMSVCYDMRFAQLYRSLAQAGARILTAPAAFTVPTGEAHWHVLLRARAIETGSFVLAPAQTGTHAEGRRTYGHSLVVSPWGEVLADGGTEPGIVTATLDLDAVEVARQRIPALLHDRPFSPPVPISAMGRAAE